MIGNHQFGQILFLISLYGIAMPKVLTHPTKNFCKEWKEVLDESYRFYQD
jgi:hypothetical protein